MHAVEHMLLEHSLFATDGDTRPADLEACGFGTGVRCSLATLLGLLLRGQAAQCTTAESIEFGATANPERCSAIANASTVLCVSAIPVAVLHALAFGSVSGGEQHDERIGVPVFCSVVQRSVPA